MEASVSSAADQTLNHENAWRGTECDDACHKYNYVLHTLRLVESHCNASIPIRVYIPFQIRRMNELGGNCYEINYTLINHVNMLLLLHESTGNWRSWNYKSANIINTWFHASLFKCNLWELMLIVVCSDPRRLCIDRWHVQYTFADCFIHYLNSNKRFSFVHPVHHDRSNLKAKSFHRLHPSLPSKSFPTQRTVQS